MSNQRYALISVSDKTGIVDIANALVKQGVRLMSTGGTYQVLAEAGLAVVSVDSVTGFPEMMDGRVKTLHPAIHAGLLALRDNASHQKTMRMHHIYPIDYVIVNLYPFRQTIVKKPTIFSDAIDNIDIGGPSMLRSAAKNHQSVTVVTDPQDYATLIAQLASKGQTTLVFRQYLARKVYQLTAHYDALISQYLCEHEEKTTDFQTYEWPQITLTYVDEQILRYGENSHQQAKVYQQIRGTDFALTKAIKLQGKALSYNNYKDGDAAIKIAREFTEPLAVAVKHMNPCGVAIAQTIQEAFDRCYAADPISIFGGIIVLNRPVTLAVAQKLHQIFLEMVIAPSFEPAALAVLSKKKNLRLMALDFASAPTSYQPEAMTINGGLLMQEADHSDELCAEDGVMPPHWNVMTNRAPQTQEIKAINFAMKVCKHVKSNAIVVSNQYMTLGIGAGQMSRIASAKIALQQAMDHTRQDGDALVMASDAFFPMDDTVTVAQSAGITAIIQPGGSLKDQDSVDVCNAYNIAMVKTGIRHFRH